MLYDPRGWIPLLSLPALGDQRSNLVPVWYPVELLASQSPLADLLGEQFGVVGNKIALCHLSVGPMYTPWDNNTAATNTREGVSRVQRMRNYNQQVTHCLNWASIISLIGRLAAEWVKIIFWHLQERYYLFKEMKRVKPNINYNYANCSRHECSITVLSVTACILLVSSVFFNCFGSYLFSVTFISNIFLTEIRAIASTFQGTIVHHKSSSKGNLWFWVICFTWKAVLLRINKSEQHWCCVILLKRAYTAKTVSLCPRLFIWTEDMTWGQTRERVIWLLNFISDL